MPCFHLASRIAALLVVPAIAIAQGPPVRAFTGLTLIDGTARAPVPNATIVVRDGRIVAAGPSSTVRIPVGARTLALTGKTVIPGIINAHGHVNAPKDLSTYAAYGVTTVFSLGGEPQSVFAARAAQNTPALDRARVFLAGTVLTPKTPDEARAQVAQDVAQHVDIVKIRVDDNLGTTPKMTPEVYRAVIAEAHKRGMRVATHLFYLDDAKSLLDAGSDFVAHSIRDADVDADVIAKLKQRNVCVSPTLMREVSTFVYEKTPDFFSDSLFLTHANREWMANLEKPDAQQAMRASPAAQRYKVALEVTAATRDAARCMKLDRDLGTLEPGKWADFVVLDADPLANISNVKRIASVWIAGNQVKR
jgi:imidazolonepropionase-like amidohydrolase